MALPNNSWDKNKSKAAMAEGWDLFVVDLNVLEIQRDDESDQFESDEGAQQFVLDAAFRGSLLHQSACECLYKTNPQSLIQMLLVYEGVSCLPTKDV